MKQEASKNRRNYFRISFDKPLCSTMSISLINNCPVNTGKTKVCIENISASGLKFVSNFKMPISRDVIINFNTKILNQTIQFSGWIVRRDEIEENIWEYGVHFLSAEKTSSKYLDLLNKLTLKLRKNTDNECCSFCSKEDRLECMRLQRKGNI